MMYDPYSTAVYETMIKRPPFESGQLVKVYNYDDPEDHYFCGIGRVKKVEWSKYYLMWLADVEMNVKGQIKELLLYAHYCRPVKLSGRDRLH